MALSEAVAWEASSTEGTDNINGNPGGSEEVGRVHDMGHSLWRGVGGPGGWQGWLPEYCTNVDRGSVGDNAN